MNDTVHVTLPKIAIDEYSSSTFLFYRFFAATIVLSLIFWRYLKKTDLKSVKIGVGLSVPLCFGIYLQTLGIHNSSASQSAFIAGMTVVIIPLIKLIIYRTSLPLKLWVASSMALLGLFVISIKESFTINTGDLYTLIGAFGFAVYLLQVEKHSAKKNIIYTIVPMFASCALFTLVISLFDSTADWLPDSSDFWQGIIYCALFSTAYMYTVSNISQRFIKSEQVAIIYLFEPLFGAIAAFFLLDESLSYRLLIGGSLIFVATLISELKVQKKLFWYILEYLPFPKRFKKS